MTLDNQRLVQLALQQLEAERQKIEGEIAALRGQIGSKANRTAEAAPAAAPAKRGRRRGRISAEGRKRISDAAKRRWAEFRSKKPKSGRG